MQCSSSSVCRGVSWVPIDPTVPGKEKKNWNVKNYTHPPSPTTIRFWYTHTLYTKPIAPYARNWLQHPTASSDERHAKAVLVCSPFLATGASFTHLSNAPHAMLQCDDASHHIASLSQSHSLSLTHSLAFSASRSLPAPASTHTLNNESIPQRTVYTLYI